MDFLKKHYEKVLLGAVLLGLAGAVAFLFLKIASEKEDLQNKAAELKAPRVTPLAELDLSAFQLVLQRVAAPVVLDLASPHKLFNPMPWQKTPDARLVRLDSSHIGPRAVQVTKLHKLYLELNLDNITPEGNEPKFLIGVKREAARTPKERAKSTRYCKVGDKNVIFTVKAFGGPLDNPTNVVVVLNDTGQEVALSNEKTNVFRRVDGYTADLKYGPDSRLAWANRRANQGPPLSFGGEDYDIVSITRGEVVLRAKSNGKKWTIVPESSPD